MLRFTTRIEKFEQQGEKTGWTYLRISAEQAAALQPGSRRPFRVKGTLDQHPLMQQALLPMGDGSFVMPLNAALRKNLKKAAGDTVLVCLEPDAAPLLLDGDFMHCLHDEPLALHTFQVLPKGHQQYFSNWIASAKTAITKARRIAMAVTALSRGRGFSQMLRDQKDEKARRGF